MVRRSGRSRGCKVCLQRRIKCDEVSPECGQCLRAGKQCPGPLVGPILLEMGAQAARRTKRPSPHDPDPKDKEGPERRRSPARAALRERHKGGAPEGHVAQTDIITSPLPQVSTPEHISSTDPVNLVNSDNDGPSDCDRAMWRMPSLYNPPRCDIFQQHFLAHFISSFGKNHPGNMQRTWMHELPLVLNTHPSSSVNYAIRAATMAFYGSLVNDESIQIEACKWYARGLVGQRSQISGLEAGLTGSADPGGAAVAEVNIPSEEAICTSIMLGYFEISCSTTPLGWFQHIQGAARLLEMRGPQNCQIGIAHRMFRTVRLNMVYDSIEKRTPSIFASSAWCVIPFSVHPKTLPDTVIDVLMAIPGCMALYDRLAADKCQSPQLARMLGVRISTLLRTLSEFWTAYQDFMGHHAADPSLKAQRQPHEEGLHDGSFVATTIARYHAANAILYSLLQDLQRIFPSLAIPPPEAPQPAIHRTILDTAELSARVKAHSTAVLSVLEFLRPGLAENTSLLQMVFPLLIVNPLSWQEDQRERVERGLAKLGWGGAVRKSISGSGNSTARTELLSEASTWYINSEVSNVCVDRLNEGSG